MASCAECSHPTGTLSRVVDLIGQWLLLHCKEADVGLLRRPETAPGQAGEAELGDSGVRAGTESCRLQQRYLCGRKPANHQISDTAAAGVQIFSNGRRRNNGNIGLRVFE